VNKCHDYQSLKREYESALRELKFYESGGSASTQQAIRYEGEAMAVSAAAGDRLRVHSTGCSVCRANRE
jgi:hypothetical protein